MYTCVFKPPSYLIAPFDYSTSQTTLNVQLNVYYMQSKLYSLQLTLTTAVLHIGALEI